MHLMLHITFLGLDNNHPAAAVQPKDLSLGDTPASFAHPNGVQATTQLSTLLPPILTEPKQQPFLLPSSLLRSQLPL